MLRRSTAFLLLSASAALALASVALPRAAQEKEDEPDEKAAPGQFTRVPPAAPEAAPEGRLDSEQVVTLLTEPDLDVRERNFDRLVRAARFDRRVLGLISEVAESRVDPELAWTARLALREVRSGRGALGWPFAGEELPSPLSWLDVPDPDAFGLFGGPLPRDSSARSVELKKDESGCVLRIRETKDGEEEPAREYRGESLEAILEANPELKELGIGGQDLPGGLLLRMGTDPAQEWRDLLEGLRTDWTRLDPFGRLGGPQENLLKEFFLPLQPLRAVNPEILGVRVRPVPAEQAQELGLEQGVGLSVGSVEPGSMAHLLGVGPGSVLLELNGRPLTRAEDVSAVLRARGPHEEVRLVWIDAAGEKQTNVWRPSL
ncbi:MAG: PDZ domain-containing protein [Planctomycetota bacterium]